MDAETKFSSLDEQGPVFDEHGLPEGSWAAPLWDSFLEKIDSEQEESGWDLPPRLHLVCNPVDTQALLYSRNVDPDQVWPAAPGEPGAMLSYVRTDLPGSHPVESLWGFTAPAWASAVVLTCEVWSTLQSPDFPVNSSRPSAKTVPSEAPERVEQRLTVMVTRAGKVYQRLRSRGETDPWQVPPGMGPAQGWILDALHQVIGAPSFPDSARPAPVDLFCDVLVATSLKVHDQARQEYLSREDPRGSRSLPPEVTYTYAFLTVASSLLWEFTDGGRVGLTARQRDLVSSLRGAEPGSYSGSSPREVIDQLRMALESVRQLTWTEFMRRPAARALIEERLWECIAENTDWAGEDLLASAMARLVGVRCERPPTAFEDIPVKARALVAPLLTALSPEGS